jgi:hypothetical protein
MRAPPVWPGGSGGGVRLMEILTADARAPGHAPLPGGRAELDRGPFPPLRSAPTPITATPRRTGGGLIRMTAETLGVRRRRRTHSTPLQQQRPWAAATAGLPTEGSGPATGPESSVCRVTVAPVDRPLASWRRDR